MRPLKFRWDGHAMIPLAPALAASQYTAEEVYHLEVLEERSANSHNHYFAAINEGWQNLPETLALQFPTPEHLRKFLLIRTGYRDERTIAAASKAEAQRIAAFIRPMDEFAIVTVHEATVSVFTAKSQSARAQGKKEFHASKDAVLDELAALIGIERQGLTENTGQAA